MTNFTLRFYIKFLKDFLNKLGYLAYMKLYYFEIQKQKQICMA